MADVGDLAGWAPDQEVLLVLIATPGVEDALVDWLLARDELSGFTTQRLEGHSAAHQHLSIAEQVAGRKRQVMFHLHAPYGTVQVVLDAMRRDFAGAGLHYWLMPVLGAGNLG
jgi:hypothetical protein